MVDTIRTLTDLLNNFFQDGQPAGSITPNDVRDFLVSVSDPHFSGTLNVAAETSIATQDVFVKAAGTTTLSVAKDWTQTADGTWRYDGPVVSQHQFVALMSWSAATGGEQLRFRLAKNGTTLPASEQNILPNNASDIQAVTIGIDISMATNDTIEIFCANGTSTNNMTLEFMCIMARGLFG